MNDEIKEILDNLKNIEDYLSFSEASKLLDYITNLQKTNKNHSKKLIELGDKITNLQQENKEWGMIFDTFSSRPYAHRYLEEKRKELGNKRIMGLDSEMIYKEYYDLKEIEQEHKKINGELRERIAYLERSNNRREDTILGLRQEINDVEDKNSKLEIALQNIQEDYDRRVKEINVLKDTLTKIKDLNTMQYLNEKNFKYSLNEILQNESEKDE